MGGEYRVDGHIFLEYGLPAKGATVRLYGKGFGGRETMPRNRKTDQLGHFKILQSTYENKTAPVIHINSYRGTRRR